MTYTERERQPDTTTHDSIPAETGKNDGDKTSGDCISRTKPDIIRCKDCKYYKYGICMKIGANKSFYGFCDWAERGEQNE